MKGVAILFGFAAGVLLARKAAAMDPVEALRTEQKPEQKPSKNQDTHKSAPRKNQDTHKSAPMNHDGPGRIHRRPQLANVTGFIKTRTPTK